MRVLNIGKRLILVKKPLSIWTLLAVPLVFLAVLLLLHEAGARARKFIPVKDNSAIEIAVLRSNVDLYHYWKRLELKGRIVVHAGRYLHYVAEKGDSMGYRATKEYPVIIQPRKGEIEKSVNYANFLRVTVQANMARTLYMLMPVDEFNSRFSSDTDYPERGTGTIRTHDFGTPRMIVTTLPELKERVVLNIDATYLSGSQGKNVLDKLLGDAAKADVITFCLSEDNPDVQEHERIEAMQLLEKIAAASNGKIKLLKNPKGLP